MSWSMTCCMDIFCGFIFLIYFRFAETLAPVRRDLGEKFDQKPEQLITEFADVTKEPQRLSPHRGHLDHKVKLTGYPHRQRTNWLSLPEYEELKKQLIKAMLLIS